MIRTISRHPQEFGDFSFICSQYQTFESVLRPIDIGKFLKQKIFLSLWTKKSEKAKKLAVVYFDMRTGALPAVHWSKSFFEAKTTFSFLFHHKCLKNNCFNTKTNDVDQQMVCGAGVRWSKYTTISNVSLCKFFWRTLFYTSKCQ